MKVKAHEHEYITDDRPDWGGLICRKCGMHVPKNLMHVRAVQERIVDEGSKVAQRIDQQGSK